MLDFPQTPLLLHQEAAARHLGVTARTLRNWAKAGRGPQPVITAGRARLYDVAALEAFAMGAAR